MEMKASEKKSSEKVVMLKEAAILFAITLFAGLLLGVVYEVTKAPILKEQERKVQQACLAVFPEAADAGLSFAVQDVAPSEALVTALEEKGVCIGTVFAASTAQSGEDAPYGYVIESTTKRGYGGNIVLYVGVTKDLKVSGVSILSISETAGLGMEAPKVLVPQFAGKPAETFTYTKTGSKSESEVDAISGATITTSAVVEAVNGAVLTAQELLQGGGMNE